MKKFLSMVLALVMAMSLVTISAGAADFTDKDSIDYLEAVEVMTAIGVVDGYTDGSFGPNGYLTRGAAAKIICNLILGPTTAEALVADAAPYSDVPTSNVFAGYIAYCQKEGIISGYADGTFRPGNSLTGYAFMKMLLGALGYDASIEGYTGNNWSINVAKQAINIGLEDGLEGDFNGVNTVTRQEALLYAFNAMQADVVEYPNNTTITVGDVKVTTTASASTVEYATDKHYDEDVTDDEELQFCEKYFADLTCKGAEDAYGRPATTWTWKKTDIGTYGAKADLVYTEAPSVYALRKALGLKIGAAAEFDFAYSFHADLPAYYGYYPADQWMYDGEATLVLPTVDGSNDETTLGQAYTDADFETEARETATEAYEGWYDSCYETYANGYAEYAVNNYGYKFDGVNYTYGADMTEQEFATAFAWYLDNWYGEGCTYDYLVVADVEENMEGTVDELVEDFMDYMKYYPIYGKGQRIEVYFDSVKNADGDYSDNKIVVIDETFGKITAVKTDDDGRYVTVNTLPGEKFYTDDFAKNDYVVYTTGVNANDAGDHGIVSMAAAEKLSGTVTYYNASTYVVIDGVGYYCHAADWLTNYAIAVGNEVDVWFDSYGRIVNMKVTDASTDMSNMLTIFKKGNANLLGYVEAIAVYGDGTSEVVTLKNPDETTTGKVYTYTTSSGMLKTVDPSGYVRKNGASGVTYTKGQTTIAGMNVDANTTFVYIDTEDGETIDNVKTYVGYKNAPTITGVGATVFGLQKSGADAAALVYVMVDYTDLSSTATDFIMVLPQIYYKWTALNEDGGANYYYALATLNGDYLYVDATSSSNIYTNSVEGVKSDVAAILFDTVTYDAETGYADSAVNDSADKVIEVAAGDDDYVVKYKNGVLFAEDEDYIDQAYALADDVTVYSVAYNGKTVVEMDLADLDGEFYAYTLILNDPLAEGGEIETIIVREAMA